VDFFASREEAEQTLEVILRDEPQWAGMMEIVPVEVGETGLN
jgi:hypothetical protein